MKGAAQAANPLKAEATVSGTLDALEFSVQTNLADALAKGLAGQLQAKVNEARKMIQDKIEKQISGPKKALTESYGKTRDQLTGTLDARKKQADALVGQAQGKVDQAKAELGRVQAAAQRQAGEALKKKLPF